MKIFKIAAYSFNFIITLCLLMILLTYPFKIIFVFNLTERFVIFLLLCFISVFTTVIQYKKSCLILDPLIFRIK